jgi:hypothetical protein
VIVFHLNFCYSFLGFFSFMISLACGIFLLRLSQKHELRIPRPFLFHLGGWIVVP